MTLYNYLKLSINERADYLWEYGEFFSSKGLDNSKLVFYTLNDFYVVAELVKDVIQNVKPFKRGVYLDYMLEDIEIKFPSLFL